MQRIEAHTCDLVLAAPLFGYHLQALHPHCPKLVIGLCFPPWTPTFPSSVPRHHSSLHVAAALWESEVAQKTNPACDLVVYYILSPLCHHLNSPKNILLHTSLPAIALHTELFKEPWKSPSQPIPIYTPDSEIRMPHDLSLLMQPPELNCTFMCSAKVHKGILRLSKKGENLTEE